MAMVPCAKEATMQAFVRIGVASFAILLALIGPSGVAAACECPPPPDALDALRDSTAVFVGTVERIDDPQPSLRTQRSFPYLLYDVPAYAPRSISFAVSQIWRGPPYRTIVITTGISRSQCGVDVRVGTTYLVYAYVNGVGDLITHRCSRTVPIDAARADLAVFGAGNRPSKDAPASPIAPAMLLAGFCTIILAALLLVGLFRLTRRRQRR
jgi:hypothetical protein